LLDCGSEYDWDHYLRGTNESYKVKVILAAFDCAQRRYAIVSETLHQSIEEMDRVVQAIRNDQNNLQWFPVLPGTILAGQLEAVCAVDPGDRQARDRRT
jgi:hypothetical protein